MAEEETPQGDTPVEDDTPIEDEKPGVDDPAKVLELARKKDRENLSLKKKLDAANEELTRLREFEEGHKTEQQKAIDVAVKEAVTAERSRLTGELLEQKILTRAASKLADPTDAALLDMSALSWDDDKGIDAALDALIKAKPHLAKSPNGKPPAPKDETPSDDPNKWMREAIYGRSR